MDGIFGVGLWEMILIALVLMIVGGPRNTVKWAREAGRMTRQFQIAWHKLTADLTKELDDETREILTAGRDLATQTKKLATASSPKSLAQGAGKVLKELEAELSDVEKEFIKQPIAKPTNKKAEPAKDSPAPDQPIETDGDMDAKPDSGAKYEDWVNG